MRRAGVRNPAAADALVQAWIALAVVVVVVECNDSIMALVKCRLLVLVILSILVCSVSRFNCAVSLGQQEE